MHFQLDLLEMGRFLKLHPGLLRWVMDEDNTPSSQSEHFSEHPFRYYCACFVFPCAFFFYLSAASHPIYVLIVKTGLKSLRTNCENVNGSGNATGIFVSFCVEVMAATGCSPRDHPDTVCPGTWLGWAIGLACVVNDENWVRTASAGTRLTLGVRLLWRFRPSWR